MQILEGVLRMPPELWDGSELDVLQRHERYKKAADLLEKFKGLLAIIHHDGGQYTEKHGAEKAIEDAIRLICRERVELENKHKRRYQPLCLSRLNGAC